MSHDLFNDVGGIMKTSIATVAALLAVSPAYAQIGTSPPEAASTDVPGDIIVTAQRRSERLQDVPVSVSAMTADDIVSANARDPRDLQNIVPNLQFRSSSAVSTANIFIRGVGTSDFNSNTVGAVGVYVDDVFIGANAAKLFNVFDSAGIEVLRGPQGTLYGRNTTAGAIKFASHLPDDELTGSATLQYGRFDNIRVDAALGGPLVPDLLKFRVAGFYERNDGTTYNRLTGDRVNNLKFGAGRAILDLTPDDTFLLRASAHVGINRGGARQFTHRGLNPDGTDLLGYIDTDASPWNGSYNVEGEERIDVVGGSLKMEKTFGAFGLSSITDYEYVKHTTLEDTDASPNNILMGIYADRDRQFTQELRAHSVGNAAFGWSLGLYYYHDRLTSDGSFDLLRDLRDPTAPDNGFDPANSIGLLRYPFRQKTVSKAAFAQADYKLTDTLKATIGLRYTHDRVAMDYNSFFDDENGLQIPLATLNDADTFSNISYRAALDWKISPSTLVYASISSGYNAGGFSGASATEQSQLTPFSSEKLVAYEAGIKTDLFDRFLRFNAAGFYYDYSNLQVFIIDGTGAIPIQRKTNAGNARVWGFETELAAHLSPALTLSASGAYLNAQYRDFADAAGDYSGNRLTNAPEFSGAITLAYDHEFEGLGRVSARIDEAYQTRIYFSPQNDPFYSQKGYALTNARVALTLPGDRWTFAVYGKNIFQQRYLRDITPLITLDQLNYGDPATYGLQIGLQF
jgi:iron complex outermembrane receptor protein